MKSERNLLRIIRTTQTFAFVTVHTPFFSRSKAQPEKKSHEFVAFTVIRLVLWIDAWQEFGFKGLEDSERSGRPPILTVEEQEKAVEIALRNPKFPHRQLSAIKEEIGKEISRFTLKDLVKKKTIFGKESCFGLWKQTDEDEKEFAKQDLAELTRKADKGWLDLAYFDCSGFNLWAKVVYAWQKRGERIASSGLKRQVKQCSRLYVASVSEVCFVCL